MRSLLYAVVAVAALAVSTTRAFPGFKFTPRGNLGRQPDPEPKPEGASLRPAHDALSKSAVDWCLDQFSLPDSPYELEERVERLTQCLASTEESYGILNISPEQEREIVRIVNFRFIECMKKGEKTRAQCRKDAKVGNYLPQTRMWFENQKPVSKGEGLFNFKGGFQELRREFRDRFKDAWGGQNRNGAGAGARGVPRVVPLH